MALNDEIKQERDKMKGKSTKDKLQYFLDYYLLQTVIAAIVIVFVIAMIHSLATKKETMYYSAFVNSSMAQATVNSEDMQDELTEILGLNTKKETTMIDTSVTYETEDYSEVSFASSEKLAVLVASGSLDSLVADQKLFKNFASQGLMQDLRLFMPEETLQKYASQIYYITDPDSKEQIPVGIMLPEDSAIYKFGYYPSHEAMLGVVVNAHHADKTAQFLDYIAESK